MTPWHHDISSPHTADLHRRVITPDNPRIWSLSLLHILVCADVKSYDHHVSRNIVSSKAPTAAENTAAENTAAENTAAENTAAENTAAENTAAENTAAENTAAENTAAENTASENTAEASTQSANTNDPSEHRVTRSNLAYQIPHRNDQSTWHYGERDAGKLIAA